MTAYEPCSDCQDPEHCAVRELMRETRAALSGVLDQCSLKTLTERTRQATWMQSVDGDAA
jgi:DNA-binding IscR family transcriptional regulator